MQGAVGQSSRAILTNVLQRYRVEHIRRTSRSTFTFIFSTIYSFLLVSPEGTPPTKSTERNIAGMDIWLMHIV